MDADAKKKVATAAKQAKHAVSNIEDATVLEAEEVVQTIAEVAKPFLNPLMKRTVAGTVLVLAGAAGYHVVSTKLLIPLREKRQVAKLKSNLKQAEREERMGVDGEVVSGPTVRR